MNQALKYASLGSRFLLGVIFVVFGLNGFFNFLPMPPMPEAPMNFVMALANSGYLLALVKGMEVICGAMILSGLFLPLALVLLAPIVVNIVLFHTILAPEGAGMAFFILAMWALLVWCYRSHYTTLFAAKGQTSC
jgi:uncharacterized membrane protein YphA (DoxX/SURF4 family)